MIRLTAAAAVLASIGLVPVADAKVVSKPTGQDRAAVTSYWTGERMRDARPAVRAAARQPQGKAKPGAGWSTLRVHWPSADLVVRSHGKVFFTQDGVNYVCSGTAVTSSSESVVWTAGHCVNDGADHFVTNWMFVPAYGEGGVREPYGRWTAQTLHTTSEWASRGDFGRDLGAAKAAPRADGVTLHDALPGGTRTLGFSSTYAIGSPIDAYGYPAAGKYDGQSLYMCDTYVSRRDTSTSPAAVGIPCGMTGGSSGGGWIDPASGQVVSVVSYGYQGLKDVLFGPVQDAAASELLGAADGA